MKLGLRGRLVRFVAACALGLVAQSLLFAEDSPPAAALAEFDSGEIIRKAFLAFVSDSLVPADSRTVGKAALAVLAPEGGAMLPESFGNEAAGDADWLAAQAGGTSSPWPVVDAMARAARIVHMNLLTPARTRGLRAGASGNPLSSPGFSLYPLSDGRLVVRDVVPGASADTSGLRVGDVLVEVEGKVAVPADTFLLRTIPAGTDVALKIVRTGKPAEIVLHLNQAEVSAVESRLMDDGVAWVLVRWFSRSADPARDTAALFRRNVQALIDQGARGLVIDLRSALGGSGEVNMVSALFDGPIIYSIRKPMDAPVRPVARNGECLWPDLPVVILQHRGTTSAGEDLALALREFGRAKVVGETSGGGLTEFDFVPLAEGYGVIIPRGVVLGPVSGECPAGYAIIPDIEVSNPSIEEILDGRDRQLDAARVVLSRK
jgi:C-terminal processing protease CtpA/Prc